MSDHTRLWNSTWMKGEVDLVSPFDLWPSPEVVPVETLTGRLAREFLEHGGYVVDRTGGFHHHTDGSIT